MLVLVLGIKILYIMHYDIGFGWGAAACQKSIPRIPISDKRVMDFIKENCKEVGSSQSLTKGWLAGYEWQIDQDMKAAGF